MSLGLVVSEEKSTPQSDAIMPADWQVSWHKNEKKNAYDNNYWCAIHWNPDKKEQKSANISW